MSQQRDLNPRPTVYKTVALPLSYAGVIFILTVVSPLAPPCGVNPVWRGKLCWLVFVFIFGIGVANLIPIRMAVAVHLHLPFSSYVVGQL